MNIIKSAIAVAAVSAACILSSTAANAQWGFPGYGYGYGYGPGVSIGIGGPGVGFYMNSGVPYYGGYQGYPGYRPGYRLYNGFYFPLAAFGVAVTAPRAYVGGSAHVQWCYQNYPRSYRESDNTFQPYNGPRQECVSPY